MFSGYCATACPTQILISRPHYSPPARVGPTDLLRRLRGAKTLNSFVISKRTTQRMLRALEAQFTDTSIFVDEEGRKRWRLPSGALRDLISLSAEELAAPDMAVETMKRAGLIVEAGDLLNLNPCPRATLEGSANRNRSQGLTRGARASRTSRAAPAHRPQHHCGNWRGY